MNTATAAELQNNLVSPSTKKRKDTDLNGHTNIVTIDDASDLDF